MILSKVEPSWKDKQKDGPQGLHRRSLRILLALYVSFNLEQKTPSFLIHAFGDFISNCAASRFMGAQRPKLSLPTQQVQASSAGSCAQCDGAIDISLGGRRTSFSELISSSMS